MKLKSFIARLRDDESGATAIEYGLICAMIVIAMIAALKGVADSTVGLWTKVKDDSATAIAGSSA